MGAGNLLFWTWFGVAVLFGIAAAADIVGNGPYAYLGGVLTGATYLLAYRLTPKVAKTSGSDETQTLHAAERDDPSLAVVQREGFDVDPAQEKIPAASKRKGVRRGRSRSRNAEPVTMLDRLKSFSRRFR
jgi:hypothetical protein